MLHLMLQCCYQEGLSVILSESDLARSRDMLDSVFMLDRGEVRDGASVC